MRWVRARPDTALMLLAFGMALFPATSLLFAVQPLMSKVLLPLFGGSALVWAAALVFFQAGLLAGYADAFDLGALPTAPGWHPLSDLDPVLWTDDYSDLVSVLRWR